MAHFRCMAKLLGYQASVQLFRERISRNLTGELSPGHRRRDGGAAEDSAEPRAGKHTQLHQDAHGGHAQAVQAPQIRLRIAG